MKVVDDDEGDEEYPGAGNFSIIGLTTSSIQPSSVITVNSVKNDLPSVPNSSGNVRSVELHRDHGEHVIEQHDQKHDRAHAGQ